MELDTTAWLSYNMFIKCRSKSLKSEDDDSLGEFGLSEDYDYEVDDNTDKFKTLNDKTILYFIENYRPDKNNTELVSQTRTWDPQVKSPRITEPPW